MGYMKILMVDDSRTVLVENKRALMKAGYDVLCAETGETALNLASNEHPDLILLDLLLPGMDGLQILQKLKANKTTRHIAVVVVSSLSSRNASRLIETGAEDYIEKNAILEHGHNRLPEMLVDIVCRINRKKGTHDLTVPLSQ